LSQKGTSALFFYKRKDEDMASINDIKITEGEVAANGVSALRDAPNRRGGFGNNGLTAEELKARFDELPKLIVKKLNALIAYIQSDAFAGEVKVGDSTLSKLLGNAKTYADALAEALDERVKDIETGFDGALDEIIRLQDYYTGKTFDDLHAHALKLINGGAEDVS
jgi:hypothetical protein